MHLVQLLLPLFDNERRPFPRSAFDEVRLGLTERFGGVTAYLRAPADGAWQEADGEVSYDQIVIFEVMVAVLDRAWWAAEREALAHRFRQEEVVVRALPFERL